MYNGNLIFTIKQCMVYHCGFGSVYGSYGCTINSTVAFHRTYRTKTQSLVFHLHGRLSMLTMCWSVSHIGLHRKWPLGCQSGTFTSYISTDCMPLLITNQQCGSTENWHAEPSDYTKTLSLTVNRLVSGHW